MVVWYWYHHNSSMKASIHFVSTFVFVLEAWLADRVETLSSTSPSRQFIEIKKANSLPMDRLPASLIADWPTFVLDPFSDDMEEKWTRIPDADGFVNPTSIDELWQPMDLVYPSCQLAIGLHIRDGSIRHVLPAVDLTLQSTNNAHRNRGLCTVPRAYQWMDFGSLALGGGLEACRLVLQSRSRDENVWKTHTIVDSVGETISLAVESLADDPPNGMGEGSCLIHVLCQEKDDDADLSSIPPVGSDLRCLLLEEDGSILGALQVKISKTAAGSESEYMPSAYSDLFEDASLRRPAFAEMKRRMEMSKGVEEH